MSEGLTISGLLPKHMPMHNYFEDDSLSVYGTEICNTSATTTNGFTLLQARLFHCKWLMCSLTIGNEMNSP